MQLIVDILSFETSPEVLQHQLSGTTIDWDQIVSVASVHLVLPAVYCRLQQKSVLRYLPEDLVFYLEELTLLNRDRNHQLLIEVEHISKLFVAHDINHVFIKGVALLTGEYFEDIGERMIGDIDILVASEDLTVAFDLLVEEGYTQSLPFNYKVKNYRHLPRQISEKYLGAIELHDQLLKHRHNQLISKESFLLNKQTVKGISIPNSEHLIWNTILAQQINDRGHYYNVPTLKGIYDVLVVGLPKKIQVIKALSKQRYGLSFLNLASIFSPEITPFKETALNRIHRRNFLLTLRFPKYGNRLMKVKSAYIGMIERLKLLVFNKSYRIHVFNNKLNE